MLREIIRPDSEWYNLHIPKEYVMLDIERYNEFRQNELELAHFKVMQDMKEGRYKTQTASEHAKELIDAL